MGGVIVFEMAQQLHIKGENVAFLGLVESWLPRSVEFHSYRFPMLRRLYHGINHQFDIMKESGWQSWIDHLKQKSHILQEENNNTDIFGRDESGKNRDMITALNYQALRKYELKLYQGPVTYFLASDRKGVDEIEDPRLDWEKYCPNGFEVFRVGANSAGQMFKLPHVKILVNQLSARLSHIQNNQKIL